MKMTTVKDIDRLTWWISKPACSIRWCWGTTWLSLCIPRERFYTYRSVSLESQIGRYLNRAIRWRINTALSESCNNMCWDRENPWLPPISPLCHQRQLCLFHDEWKLCCWTSIIPGTVTLTSLILWRTEQWRTTRPSHTLQSFVLSLKESFEMEISFIV